MLYRYEKRTGHVVGLSELESGELRSKLTEDDYNIKDMVSPTYFFIPTLYHTESDVFQPILRLFF